MDTFNSLLPLQGTSLTLSSHHDNNYIFFLAYQKINIVTDSLILWAFKDLLSLSMFWHVGSKSKMHFPRKYPPGCNIDMDFPFALG